MLNTPLRFAPLSKTVLLLLSALALGACVFLPFLGGQGNAPLRPTTPPLDSRTPTSPPSPTTERLVTDTPTPSPTTLATRTPSKTPTRVRTATPAKSVSPTITSTRPTQTPWSSATPEKPTVTHAPTVQATWVLDWADEFDTAGAPNPAIWALIETEPLEGELQVYPPNRLENARVEDGHLILEAHREEFGGSEFTSGALYTYDLVEFKYGRVEMRAKLPSAAGTEVTFFLNGSNVMHAGWPECGEIDLIGYVGELPDRVFTMVFTGKLSPHNPVSEMTTIRNLTDDFHIFVAEWYPDRIELFIDGKRTLEFWNEGTGEHAWPFDQHMFLGMRLAVGPIPKSKLKPEDIELPAQFMVDYVRVYRDTHLDEPVSDRALMP